MGLAIADHLDVLDRADSAEEFLQVALGGVEGEVADVDTGRGHFDALRLAALPRRGSLGTLGAGCTLGLGSGLGGSAQTEDREDFGEETLLCNRLGRGLITGGTVFTAVPAAGAAG
jgi:hypothetical protein